jgi:hypothetical protein
MIEEVLYVDVIDWADHGPLYERWFEDGPRTVAPRHALHVTVETPRGDLYIYTGKLGVRYTFPTLHAAEQFAAKVRARGTIDLTYWIWNRAVYGSQAYVDGGYESAWKALEDEFDRR